MPGTLYVVSTPIGNLGDMTDRARDVLRDVSLVACEDTRVTAKLLRYFDIRTKTISYHEHNEAERTPKLIARLVEGEDVALVSDAGTPTISDPGYRLVRAARDAGIAIRSVPGASALLAALAVSGLPTSSFTFVGFLPVKAAARKKALAALEHAPGTIVLYESPGRLARLLDELAAELGPRPACVLREMTKLHEEHQADTLEALAAWAKGKRFKGELTLVVGTVRTPSEPVAIETLAPRFEALRSEGLSAREAAKRLAREHGLSTRDVYNELATDGR